MVAYLALVNAGISMATS